MRESEWMLNHSENLDSSKFLITEDSPKTFTIINSTFKSCTASLERLATACGKAGKAGAELERYIRFKLVYSSKQIRHNFDKRRV